MVALAKRGMTLLKAKRAIEALLENGRVFVSVPTVEDQGSLTDELKRAGIMAAQIDPAEKLDVRALRERLSLTREEFARRYGIGVDTIRKWETGRRLPDRTALSYLRAIANDPVRVEQAYAPTPAA